MAAAIHYSPVGKGTSTCCGKIFADLPKGDMFSTTPADVHGCDRCDKAAQADLDKNKEKKKDKEQSV